MGGERREPPPECPNRDVCRKLLRAPGGPAGGGLTRTLGKEAADAFRSAHGEALHCVALNSTECAYGLTLLAVSERMSEAIDAENRRRSFQGQGRMTEDEVGDFFGVPPDWRP
jgi:hypothetical protein